MCYAAIFYFLCLSSLLGVPSLVVTSFPLSQTHVQKRLYQYAFFCGESYGRFDLSIAPVPIFFPPFRFLTPSFGRWDNCITTLLFFFLFFSFLLFLWSNDSLLHYNNNYTGVGASLRGYMGACITKLVWGAFLFGLFCFVSLAAVVEGGWYAGAFHFSFFFCW